MCVQSEHTPLGVESSFKALVNSKLSNPQPRMHCFENTGLS